MCQKRGIEMYISNKMHTIAGCVFYVAVITTFFVQNSFAATPEWLVLHKGQSAFTGEDGGGVLAETICHSVSSMSRFLTGAKANCFTVMPGIPVVITSNKVKEIAGLSPTYIVAIKAADGSWQGFADSIALQPKVLKGTRLKINPGMNDSVSVQALNNKRQIELAKDIVVELIEQTANRTDDFKVKIISGNHTGEIVWICSLNVQPANGGVLFWKIPVESVGGVQKAVNTNDRNFYKTTQDANAYRDMGRCQDLFNAMHDDAALRRVHVARDAGLYTFWAKGTRVTVTSGNVDSDLFVMAKDKKGRTGCISAAWLQN
jgi:hypothetical protein